MMPVMVARSRHARLSVLAPPTNSGTVPPLSRSLSTVSVSAATTLVADVSPTTITITLQTKDGGGNNITTGGETVSYSLSGGTSGFILANGGVATDAGNGTYTCVATPTVVGTALTVSCTLSGAPVTSTMPTVQVTGATDTFTRANGGLGANWTAQSGLGTPSITNNAVGCRQFFVTTYTAQTFSADCSSEVTLAPGFLTTDLKKCPQVFVRRNASTLERYGFFVDPGDPTGLQLKFDGGVSTVILTKTTRIVPAIGDVWKITVVGNLITGYVNGVQKLQITDTRLSAAGGSGFGFVPNVGTSADDEIIGDWTGRNL